MLTWLYLMTFEIKIVCITALMYAMQITL